MIACVNPSFREVAILETTLGRAGRSEDVANVVVFLISELSSFVNGAEIPVDGDNSLAAEPNPSRMRSNEQVWALTVHLVRHRNHLDASETDNAREVKSKLTP
ncbi:MULTISPECIES: SDR family oxidoreductase [unclassified Glutamicibacter]|uniref:SDR family oxidoreductase n=1 Tax=unclassified Glutamicibacter TaxID=2627139 RepID=UPI00403403BF